jgi:NAD-dependent dihydropyrimidine dehydrogenase PreA subunit
MKYLANVVTLQLDQDLCTGCGMCKVVCPHAVFSLDNGLAQIGDKDACMECGACSRNCPEEAIFVQAGVGCAQAVINSTLGKTDTDCCSIEDYGSSGQECGSESQLEKPSGSGCC